jgi:hypothetical protein
MHSIQRRPQRQPGSPRRRLHTRRALAAGVGAVTLWACSTAVVVAAPASRVAPAQIAPAHVAPAHVAPAHVAPAHVAAAPARRPSTAGAPDLGPDVYIFSPSTPQSQIQAEVDAVATQQLTNQFGTQRYALLFEPGTYGSVADPLTFQVGYYTEVAGLGASPSDVTINGTIDVYNQCSAGSCTALDNFWRSLSNLTIDVTGQTGCQSGTDFWAVSQASPMRRVDITGGNLSLMDYCSAGPQYASGGFIADSSFSGGTVINGSQQQFIVRNSDLDGWSNGVWNQVFSGDVGAPAQAFGVTGGAGPYTTLAASPVTEEQPYLYVDGTGSWDVFVPTTEHDTVGPSWASAPTPGRSVPLSHFFVADPSTPVRAINVALASGRDLLLTPGVYDLAQSIRVLHPGTVVLGLGFATLVPQRGQVTMDVLPSSGVEVAGLIFDAGAVESRALLEMGSGQGAGWTGHRSRGSAGAPDLVSDVFFRIGGATPGRADTSLVVNADGTIIDDVWAWRADHGAGVGWTDNIADTGVVVNGDDVTAYGLAVEHYQKDEVVWNGQGGTDVFFQNEMPYDPPSQQAWDQSSTVSGYPAFVIAPSVRTFEGYGMGSYSFFDQGIDIHATEAFQAPDRPGVALHDLLTVFLNGSGGIDSVVDGAGAAVSSANPGPSDVVAFP